MSLNVQSLRPLAKQNLPLARCFSTTAQRCQVPPESPSYIRLPTPPQNEDKKVERVRGFMPVPRAVFTAGDGKRKTTYEYISTSAPKPTNKKKPVSEQQAWRKEVADARRYNFKTGLKALYQRHRAVQGHHDHQVAFKVERHRRAAQAPEREDDRITRGTVLGSLLDTKVHSDPNRFEIAKQRRSEIQATENAKKEARRDALMELYINASNFITNEAELKKEIDTVFSDDYFKSRMGGLWGAENAWGIHGAPLSFGEMLASSRRMSNKLVDVKESEYDRSVKRQKKIAEEFTGGKME